MKFPEGLYYTESHEWLKDEDRRVIIGLTDYAQSQLKDILYVELPEIGSDFKKDEIVGFVESMKTVTDIFSPITGRVLERNLNLKDYPQLVNEDPYGKGWLIEMEIQNREELRGLLSARGYQDYLKDGE